MKNLIFFLVPFILVSCTQEDKHLTYNDVAERLIDVKRLAELPEEGEESGMFSSYDRRSKYDEETGEYIDWSANDDGLSPQFIRKEGEDMVLAEMEGPGAIVRIWSATPEQGHVKIFIDGEEEPVLDMPFRDYFNTSELPAFGYSNLVYETNARGFNNYVPITFNDSVKIVGEPGWGQYYHFNYVRFPDDHSVESFDASPSEEARQTLTKINDLFGEGLGEPFRDYTNASEEGHSVSIPAGERKKAVEIDGSRAITELRVNIEQIPTEKREELLRKTIMEIRWDDDEESAVWSPLGDFFGSAPGYNSYQTLMTGMTNEELYSYWYMPFASSAEIEFQNHSDENVELDVTTVHEDNNLPSNDFGYFHAKWHRDIMPVDSSRWPDWTVLKTEGTGRFVGMFLSVWNPRGGSCVEYGGEGHHWWGEGDEKFFVDGEKFPSTFGTGTEDYFGYAWCMPDFFEHAFHSQNYTEGNMGYQSLNRWQIIDNVPFQDSFEAYMEKYFPNHWPTQYATVAYWYLDGDGKDPLEPVPAGELYGYEKPFSIFRADDAIEGEDMEIESNTGGWASTDVFAHESLVEDVSGNKILNWFADPEKENVLETTFDIEESGKYHIAVNIIQSKEGGRFRLNLNEGSLQREIDFYHQHEDEGVRKIDLGTVELDKGQQKMEFEWLEDRSQGGRLAVDYFELTPVK